MPATRNPVLSPRQRRFVNGYLVDLNATRAAIAAGYSAKAAHAVASRLLRTAKVAQEIQRYQSTIQRKVEVTHEVVLHGLYDVAVDPKAPHGARVAAWTTLARILGMMTERLEVVGTLQHVADALKGMTIAEIRALAHGEDLPALGPGGGGETEVVDADWSEPKEVPEDGRTEENYRVGAYRG